MSYWNHDGDLKLDLEFVGPLAAFHLACVKGLRAYHSIRSPSAFPMLNHPEFPGGPERSRLSFMSFSNLLRWHLRVMAET